MSSVQRYYDEGRRLGMAAARAGRGTRTCPFERAALAPKSSARDRAYYLAWIDGWSDFHLDAAALAAADIGSSAAKEGSAHPAPFIAGSHEARAYAFGWIAWLVQLREGFPTVH